MNTMNTQITKIHFVSGITKLQLMQ